MIRQLGLPVILEVPMDESVYLALKGFDGRQAVLADDGQDLLVPLEELEEFNAITQL